MYAFYNALFLNLSFFKFREPDFFKKLFYVGASLINNIVLFSGHILLIIGIIRAHTDSTPISTFYVRSVQLSHVQLFAAPWSAAHQAFLSIAKSQSLLKLMPIES